MNKFFKNITLALIIGLLFGCNQKETTIIKEVVPANDQSRNDSGDLPPQVQINTDLDQSVPILFAKEADNQAMSTQRNTLLENDKAFLEFHYQFNKNNTLNGAHFEKGTRTFIIKAKYLDLTEIENAKLINLLNGQLDIEELRIEADRITLGETIHLPQTKVEIFAREMEVLKTGKLITSPLDQRPSARYNEEKGKGEDGAKGLRAGDIQLMVSSITFEERKGPAFVMAGGKGQDAGPGRAGINGESRHDYGGGRINHCEEKTERECPKFERPETPRTESCTTRKVWVCHGNPGWPGDGQDAHFAGFPGQPGDGGDLITNVEINSEFIDMSRGAIGVAGKDEDGGRPGNPITAYFYTSNGRAVSVSNSRTSQAGSPAIAPALTEVIGTSGTLKVVDNVSNNWITEGMLYYTLKYADELFLNNRFYLAEKEYLRAKSAIELISPSKNKEDTYNFSRKIDQQLMKMSSSLDYFGNELSWVPKLSFETNLELFKQELELASKIYYLSHWIIRSNASLEQKQKAINKAQELLFTEIEKMKEEHLKINQMLPKIVVERENTIVEEKFVNDELKRVLAIIEDRARRNIISQENKVKFRKMLKVAAAISTAVPIGQPAFRATGVAINLLADKVDLEEPMKTALELYDGYKDFNENSNMKKSHKDWNEHWKKISRLDDWSKLSKDERRESLRELRSFSEPILRTAAKEYTKWDDYKLPASAIEKEITKLKKEDPLFQELSVKISQLVKKRQSLHQNIQNYTLRRGEIEVRTFENLDAITSLQDGLTKYTQIDSDFVIEEIREMKRRSQERLLKYHYRMAKAYEYRVLSPYSSGLNLQTVWDKIETLVSHNQEIDLSNVQFDQIKDFFVANLREVILSAVSLVEENPAKSARKAIRLNQRQMNSLNQKKSIYLDLTDPLTFGSKKTDLRITGIEFSEISVKPIDVDYSSATIELTAEHDGRSYIESMGKNYLFNFDNNSDVSWKWTTQYDVTLADTTNHEISLSDQSLMSYILNGDSERQLLFARPGALTQLKIKSEFYGDAQAQLEEATIIINFEYRERSL